MDITTCGKFGKGLMDIIELSGTKEYSANDKLRSIINIIRGRRMKDYSSFKEAKVDPNDDYEGIFYKLFGNQAKKAMLLHRLISVEPSQLIKLFSYTEEQLGEIGPLQLSTYNWLCNELL